MVPYWALWPFETMIIPKTHIKRFTDLKPDNPKINSLAGIIKKLVTAYDNLFKCLFPYTMGWHGKTFFFKHVYKVSEQFFNAFILKELLLEKNIKKILLTGSFMVSIILHC